MACVLVDVHRMPDGASVLGHDYFTFPRQVTPSQDTVDARPLGETLGDADRRPTELGCHVGSTEWYVDAQTPKVLVHLPAPWPEHPDAVRAVRSGRFDSSYH